MSVPLFYFHNNMQQISIINYSAYLKWWTCLHDDDGSINKEIKRELQPIIDDINTFQPEVPIRGDYFKFYFHFNEDEEILNVSTSVNPYLIYSQDVVEQGRFVEWLDSTIVGRLKDLCFVLNLAYPSEFHILKSCIYRDDKQIIKDFYFASDALLIDDKYEWPAIEWLPVARCWEWLVTKTRFLEDTSHSPIDVALHSLSYVSTANDDTFIFYALLGLEALYNEASNREDSILEQLRFKTKAVLGDYPRSKEKIIKKAISDMYRKRSMLFHGSSTIKKCWFSFDSPDEDFEYFIESRNPIYFATILLVATIQKMIQTDTVKIIEEKHIRLE